MTPPRQDAGARTWVASRMNAQNRGVSPWLWRVLAVLFVCALTMPAAAAEVTVFAAASLKEALDQNIKAFSARSGNTVRVSYAGSNALAQQIENGAPADLFISADAAWMDHLAQSKLLAPGTRRDLLTNSLVLVAPADSAIQLNIAPNFALAAALKGGRLALANPDAVPAGKYAKSALQRLGVWATVENSLTRSENVRAALVLVARGETPLGIVYLTDARAEPRVRVVASLAADLHAPLVYPAAIVAGRSTPAGRALLEYLAGAEARVIWVRFGFGTPR